MPVSPVWISVDLKSCIITGQCVSETGVPAPLIPSRLARASSEQRSLDGAQRNPGTNLKQPPDCAEPVIGRRFAPTRCIHPGRCHTRESGIQYAAASRFCHWRSGILGGLCTYADLPVRLFPGLSSFISDFPKNISVPIYPETLLELSPSHPTRGAYHDRHETRGGMRWTRQRFARDGIAGRVGERSVSDQTAS